MSARGGALVVVALAALTTLAGCTGGDAGLAAGEVEPSGVAAATASGRDLAVTVPTGTFDLVVGDPAREVGDLTASDGTSLLRITSTFHDADVRRDQWDLAARAGAAQPVDLTVAVGDRRYPVGMIRRGASTGAEGSDVAPPDLVVAVDGDLTGLDDVRLEVGYDGLTQVVHAADGSREPSAADPLYREESAAPHPPTAACGSGRTQDRGPQVRVDCTVGPVDRVPYLPGLGWAADGHTWTVVGFSAALTAVRADGGRYAATDVAADATLDGTAPDAVLDETERQDGAAYGARLVFDTATGPPPPLTVALTWALRLTGLHGHAPAARQLTWTTTTDLGVLAPQT